VSCLLCRVQRDIKVRRTQTVFGAAWANLQALTMRLIFTLFFGRMAAGRNSEICY
jgi:ABC-type polysaccharide/polyol phosphate export permease